MSNIPKTLEQATTRLTSLGEIVTASEWERAAIVYAFTEAPGQGKRTDLSTSREVLSFEQFAKLKIHGLRSRDTVKLYRDRWTEAIELTKRKRNGRVYPVSPGDPFIAPDLEWPPSGHTTGSFDKQLAGKSVEQKAEIVDQLLSDEKVAQAYVEEPQEPEKAPRKSVDKVVSTAVKSRPKSAIAASQAIDEKIAEDEAKVKPKKGRVIKDDFATSTADLENAVVAFRAAKRALQSVLRYAVDIRGLGQFEGQARDAVLTEAESVQMVLDAIREAAQGKSMDDELAALLNDGAV